ncbi:hypothetical protein PG984_013029 [Apiospora sp. TS-2023a]
MYDEQRASVRRSLGTNGDIRGRCIPADHLEYDAGFEALDECIEAEGRFGKFHRAIAAFGNLVDLVVGEARRLGRQDSFGGRFQVGKLESVAPHYGVNRTVRMAGPALE